MTIRRTPVRAAASIALRCWRTIGCSPSVGHGAAGVQQHPVDAVERRVDGRGLVEVTHDVGDAMAGRRPRADAVRNYERLLEHAEAAFREQGTGASLEGIARQAGVAIGTLYGHFPNRRALLGAVLRQRHVDLFAFGDGLAGHADPGAALVEWTRAVARHAAAYSGLADVIAGGVDDETSELHDACARLDAITAAVLDRARAAGAVRPEVTTADLTAVMGAAAWLRGHVPPERAERLLEYTMDGLRKPVRG